MPAELKLIIVFNVILTVILAVAMLGFGGGIVPGVFPADKSVEIRLVPVEPPVADGAAGSARTARLEIPPEYRSVDLTPSPWKILPDGSIRFEETGAR